MKTLGDRLAAARKDRGLTQTALAKRVGVKQQTIGGLEKGESQGSKHIARIARELGVSDQWLESGVGPRHPEQSAPRYVDVRNRIGAGHEVRPIDDERFDFIAIPPELKDAAVLHGTSMEPRYDESDVLVYNADTKTRPEDGVGHECVCLLKDGRILLKMVRRGSKRGRYDLESVNASRATEADAELEWVIPLTRRQRVIFFV